MIYRGVSLRFAPPDEGGTFTGYAAIFGTLNRHNEIIKPGAFARSLQDHQSRQSKPSMFWMHDPREPIGVWTHVSEDKRGLKVEGQLITETIKGQEAYVLLKRGALNGLSIGFNARSSERSTKGERVLTDIDLVEISLVSTPSALDARITDIRDQSACATASAKAFVDAVRKATRSLEKT
jgi:uncharacterized protein